MKTRALYPIYRTPVRFEKVIDGLWVTTTVPAQPETEDEYFKSVELFKEPMSKPSSTHVTRVKQGDH